MLTKVSRHTFDGDYPGLVEIVIVVARLMRTLSVEFEFDAGAAGRIGIRVRVRNCGLGRRSVQVGRGWKRIENARFHTKRFPKLGSWQF